MKTIWLVDFENVTERGLGKIGAKKTDEIVVGYTDNVPRASFDALAATGAKVSFLKAETGAQSLDLCIASEIGRLAATRSPNVKFVVVSDDKGYDHLVGHWAARGRTVERFGPKEAAAEEEAAARDLTPRVPPRRLTTAGNAEVMRHFRRRGVGHLEVGRIASLAAKAKRGGATEEETRRAFEAEFGKAKGAAYYEELTKIAGVA